MVPLSYQTHRGQGGICNQVLIALGGNLKGQKDSPLGQIEAAIELIIEAGLDVSQRSRMYRTPSFPLGSGPEFVNAALECVSDLPPAEIMARLHKVEAWAGRTRRQRWEPRVLDLDLLAVGEWVLPDETRFRHWANLTLDDQMKAAPSELIVPHPRLHERAFVLVPLMDIAPDWRHPVLGRTVAQMHAAIDPADLDAIHPL